MVVIDFGYVTNPGWSWEWGHHKDEDDRFGIQVQVQAADHKLNVADAENMIHMAVTFGETVAVASQPLKIVRHATDTDTRKTDERAFIKVEEATPRGTNIPSYSNPG